MTAEGLTRQDLRACVERFRSLRGAQRALIPSVRADCDLPEADQFQWIRDELQMLFDRLGGGPDARIPAKDLRRVDHALDGYADQLRDVADQIPMAQFRASIPDLLEERRMEVIALLDLVLEGEMPDGWQFPLVVYLITQLSTAKLEDGWEIVAEPSNLSETVQRRSFQTRCDPAQISQIREAFQGASRQLEAGANLDDVVQGMRDYKEQIAPYLFAPDVLRSIVTYNLRVRTAFEIKLSQARERDAEVLRDVGSATAGEPTTGAARGAAPSADPSLGAPGLAVIEEALARRLAGTGPAKGPAAAVVAHVALGAHEETIREIFADSSGRNSAQMARRTVTLALILSSLAGNESRLRELGLQPKRLSEFWAAELLERGRQETSRLLERGAAREAKRLSEVQSRFLLPALAAARSAPAEKAPAAPSPITATRRQRPRPARRNRPRKLPDWCRVHPAVWGLALAVGGSMAGVALMDLVSVDPHAVETLSGSQLGYVSPLLVSAYRNGEGRGALFIGTLSPEWLTLEPWERDEVAKDIQQHLAGSGVYEIMLYDQSRVLRVHYANDRFRVLDRRPASG